jgi:poly-gamma-glutamate capsule biosynthesis protein CapA/YwtB (metallophosphatase superfamily)
MAGRGGAPHDSVCIFLCGDVMLGRGIDQVLPNPCNPVLHEGYADSAMNYVHLAEEANGPISRPITFPYLWGAALEAFDRVKPDVRIINLETSITRHEGYVPKGINYRVSPENAASLGAAGIDCCVLANNHVLDWERQGLLDTLDTLDRLQLKHCGAGHNLAEASEPAILPLTSGTPRSWAAQANKPGVNLVPDLSEGSAARIAEQIATLRREGDIVIVSIHWGPNWGYDIAEEQRRFAHVLVDRGDVSVIHGHSSHHPKGIEVYRNRLILYGCGDFLDDYEGIRGYEEFRGDLVLMYFAHLNGNAPELSNLDLVPLQIRRFQLARPSAVDKAWLLQTLDRECQMLGTGVQADSEGLFRLSW